MTAPNESEVFPAPLSALETGLPRPLESCPAQLLDGWLVHAAALRSGLNTLLFPGQALMAFDGVSPAAGGAFAHGVPNRTQLSAATLVQDKRMARDVLAEAGLKVPRSRTFSIRRGEPYAKRYAQELGYPVTVKPMVGESTIEVMTGIRDERALEQALSYLSVVPTNRQDFTTSSYAFTQILTPQNATSERTRGTYRYVVEEDVPGEYFRLLLVDGELASVLHLPGGPWQMLSEAREVAGAAFRPLADRIAAAVPGLSVAAADVKLPSMSFDAAADQATVIELSERPWLQAHYAAVPKIADGLAASILEVEMRDRVRVHLEQEEVHVRFTWDGLSQVEADSQALAQHAERLPLSLEVTSKDPVSGVLSGLMRGPAGAVALLNEMAAEGDVLSAPAMAVETRIEN